MEREDTGEICAANKMVIRGGMVSTWLGAVKSGVSPHGTFHGHEADDL